MWAKCGIKRQYASVYFCFLFQSIVLTKRPRVSYEKPSSTNATSYSCLLGNSWRRWRAYKWITVITDASYTTRATTGSSTLLLEQLLFKGHGLFSGICIVSSSFNVASPAYIAGSELVGGACDHRGVNSSSAGPHASSRCGESLHSLLRRRQWRPLY